MNSTRSTAIITVVGLVIGVAEALLYHNLGKHAHTGGPFRYTIPEKKEFAKIVIGVMISSVITAGISSAVESAFTSKSERAMNKDKSQASTKA
jgi:hypothetical protein